ncbi:g12844 [Coccomyxa viridis]|uniref:shikimate kinase n=1 Tax=Coccomyxa viridis TaxID=1274662 RepID=A0ABP1GGY1_9CHLO
MLSSWQLLQRNWTIAELHKVEGLDEPMADYGVLTQKMQDLAAEVQGQLEGTSIYLVGMMGSGKSTVGKLVASALKYPFLDSDTLIEQLAGCTISDIFREEGEESFREVESQVLQELMPFKAVVVSTGGGAVVRRQNWGFMQHGVVVWLTGSPELLSRRALRDGTATRPLLSQNNGQAKGTGDEYAAAVDRMRNILAERQHAYSMADVQIPLETSPSDPGDVGAAPAVVAYRLLKALSERLKKDAAAREAAKDFEIKQSGEVPSSMRVMPSRGESAATSAEE